MNRLQGEVENPPHKVLLIFIFIILTLNAFVLLTKVAKIVQPNKLFASLCNSVGFHVSLAEEVLVLSINARKPCVEVLWHDAVGNHPDVLGQTMI
jgi:hypothetical protein